MGIILQNEMQLALLEHELAEQIASGHWENYSSQYEWEYFYESDIIVDPNAPSVRYEGYRGRSFNFLSKKFYEATGEQMKALCAMSMIDPRSVKITPDDYARKIMPQFFGYKGIKTLEEFDPIETKYYFRIVTPLEFRVKLLEILPTITDDMVRKELKALTLGFKN